MGLFLTIMVGIAHGQELKQTDGGFAVCSNGIGVEIQVYSPTIIRVLKYPEGKRVIPPSFSVVKTPEKTPFKVQKEGGRVSLTTDSLVVALDVETGKITYADSRGRYLLKEKAYGIQFTPVKYADNHQTYLVRQAFRLEEEEAIYGLGQQQEGKMNQRNQWLDLHQENTQIAIPYIQSVKGYGLLWDNASYTDFTDNPMETAFCSKAGSCADYYFLYGGNADDVIRNMRDLTGQVQMNPLWTYGYWQSKERYQSQDELVGVVKKYRELGVPLDGIIQDWQYWGVDPKDWNALAFNNPNYPNPKAMIDEVHRMNAHIAISVWPSFGPNTDIYKTFRLRDWLLDLPGWPEEALPYDAFHPEARALYWERMDKNLFALGIDAWWLDATEPELAMRDLRKWKQNTYVGPYRTVANAYPIVSVGGVYERQRAKTSDKRVFILTRSAFTGQQRYGACSWSGDVQSSWEVLHKQIAAGLNFSVCGIPYWNTDIGGFASCNYYPKGIQDPAYRELYVRWMQFGTFTPMMRSHGTCTPREIYLFGEKGSWEFDALEKYIRLRYRLSPYIYSTAWNVSRYGDTFMRALFMDFPHDKRILDLNDQYMFGRSLLVAPVTEPMYVDDAGKVHLDDVKTRTVYLPDGTEWFDFWTGEKYAGRQSLEKEVPIDVMPIYVRAGSILPLSPVMQYATEKRWDKLEIRVYPGRDGEFVLYEDENDNYNYEKGIYSTIRFRWDEQNRTLVIGERKGEFPGMLKNRQFDIVLVGKSRGCGDQLTSKVNKQIVYKGNEIRVKL